MSCDEYLLLLHWPCGLKCALWLLGKNLRRLSWFSRLEQSVVQVPECVCACVCVCVYMDVSVCTDKCAHVCVCACVCVGRRGIKHKSVNISLSLESKLQNYS